MFWLYNFEYFATAFQIAKKFAKLRKSNGILGMLKTVNDLCVRAFSRVQTLPAGIWLYDVDNSGTSTACDDWSGLGLEVPERC